LCADAERVVPLGVFALRSTSRPDQFATTTPVMTAVATTRPSPSAVISQVSSRDQPRMLSFVSWL
jgi:tRNA (Thr-GGU) A37 N-methylase